METNISIKEIREPKPPRSYPTYEEWKQCNGKYIQYKLFRSYPTYEEWKRSMTTYKDRDCNFSSYPTYEEWKPYNLPVFSNKG